MRRRVPAPKRSASFIRRRPRRATRSKLRLASCGRASLPFLLDHVNIYFVDDGKGWALIDTGLGDKATLAAWKPLLGTVLRDRPLTRIIATHFHPDHVGAAGFLLKRFDVPLVMSAT